jgi:hypothetical protein
VLRAELLTALVENTVFSWARGRQPPFPRGRVLSCQRGQNCIAWLQMGKWTLVVQPSARSGIELCFDQSPRLPSVAPVGGVIGRNWGGAAFEPFEPAALHVVSRKYSVEPK